MKRFIPLLTLPLLSLAAAACSNANSETIAENAVPPSLNVGSEAGGDWSPLAYMAGRPPAESGLLVNSPITTDLNAMLGAESARFRDAMATGSTLTRDGPVLVTGSRGGDAYLVIHPADHAMEAGLKGPNGWRTWTTPGASVPRPPSVERLRSA
jgi:hypothetical protein